jgi:hypothetical protein
MAISFNILYNLNMAKRKYSDESPTGIYDNKSRARQSVEARVDPTYGQRSALPGLDDETLDYDDELNYGDEMDALAYLRSVRQVLNSQARHNIKDSQLI